MWQENLPYHLIENPDSLSQCRHVVREVIAAARQELKKNERLIVNPTSGTKQMSAAATVAALDENIGELVFTIGDRADGVVKTGTERLETFDATEYFAEQAFTNAKAMYEIGSFSSAAAILAPFAQFQNESSFCRCLHEWERNNYSEATSIIKSSSHPARTNMLHHLDLLMDGSRAGAPSPAIVADLNRSAKHLQRIGELEWSIMRASKALEMGLRLELYNVLQISEPYRPSDFDSISKQSTNLRKRIQANTKDNHVRLGFRDLVDVLLELQSPIAIDYQQSAIAKNCVQVRNSLAHHLCTISKIEAFRCVGAVSDLLSHLSLPIPYSFPKTLEKR